MTCPEPVFPLMLHSSPGSGSCWWPELKPAPAAGPGNCPQLSLPPTDSPTEPGPKPARPAGLRVPKESAGPCWRIGWCWQLSEWPQRSCLWRLARAHLWSVLACDLVVRGDLLWPLLDSLGAGKVEAPSVGSRQEWAGPGCGWWRGLGKAAGPPPRPQRRDPWGPWRGSGLGIWSQAGGRWCGGSGLLWGTRWVRMASLWWAALDPTAPAAPDPEAYGATPQASLRTKQVHNESWEDKALVLVSF